MPMPDSSSGPQWTAEFDKLVAGLAESDHALRTRMFSMPSASIGGKHFAGLYQDKMVFKLGGDAHARALALKGAHLFDPSGMGRAMKEWVVVPNQHAARWPELGEQALAYVAAKQGKS
jgi:hypothetical protein